MLLMFLGKDGDKYGSVCDLLLSHHFTLWRLALALVKTIVHYDQSSHNCKNDKVFS